MNVERGHTDLAKPGEHVGPSEGRLHTSLEVVRACAALSVVTFHALQSVMLRVNTIAGLGMDVFFLLSGFLVWDVTRRKRSTPGLFMLHRITRIAPLYTVLTLLCVLFARWTEPELLHDPMGALRHVALSLLYVPHLNLAGAPFPVVPPGWTLVFDMYFFVLFALVLIAPARRQLLAATLVFLAPLVAHAVFDPQGIVLKTYTNARCLGFLAGIWIAEAYARRWFAPLRVAEAISLLSIPAYAIVIGLHVPYHSVGVLLWILPAAMAVYGGVCAEAQGSTWGRLPFVGPLARWSFGIYLAQTLALALVLNLPRAPLPVQVLTVPALSILFGWAAHRFVEVPANRFFKRLEVRWIGSRASRDSEATPPIPLVP